MTISTISVGDMHCSVCAGKIRRALSPVTGIQNTWINPVRRLVLVEHESSTDTLEIMQRIEAAGFMPSLSGFDDHDARQRSLLKRLGIAGLAMMQVMMAAVALYAGAFDNMDPAYVRLFQYTSLFFTIPVICYSAVPFFASAVGSLRGGSGLSMDVPVALAISIAFLTSLHSTVTGSGEVYYDSVVMFTFLLLGARYIDARLQRQFNQTGQLLAALPVSAMKISDGMLQPVATATLEPGDRIWVAEGARVPLDGILLTGSAALDEAVLTGESDWVQKHQTDRVFAGTLNRGTAFGLEVSHPYDQSRIADIAQLAYQAEAAGARITRLTDRIAAVFIPAVLGLAAATFMVWQFIDPDRALQAMLTVLVVSCPCALSLATPAALTAAMTRLRRLGIVLTDSQVLERIPQIDQLFIDKTGTLTVETPTIEQVECLDPDFSMDRCLALAAALQRHSSHPFARAFHDIPASSDVADIQTVTGLGVEGSLAGSQIRIGSAPFTGATDADDRAISLSIAGRAVARFHLSDRIRADAREAISAFKSAGLTPSMLSGDSAERCAPVAAELGIDFLARQSPEDKLSAIRQAQAEGHHVLMLGDGINDVPVLAGADVSVAVVEASDLVKSQADVLLLNRRLQPLLALFTTAASTRTVIRQNLIWAAAYNLVAIPVAAMGLMPPWLAALGMAASSTLVMLNAVRLLNTGNSAGSEPARPTTHPQLAA